MIKRKCNIFRILIGCLLIPAMFVSGQTDISVSSIPQAMKENAYSVVRSKDVAFVCQSQKDGIYKETVTITVLSPNGKGAANFNCYGDNFRELKSFSGALYNENGTLLRKIKQSEVKYSEASYGLASDDKFYFYECTSPVYPYTVTYEYEVKYKRGIISFPVFIPQGGYNQSVEKASYKLVLPSTVDFKKKALHMMDTPEKQEEKDKTIYTWHVSGLTALDREPFGPSLSALLPRLYATPVHFVYADYAGDLTDWNSFGKWQYDLLQKRDMLPDAVKQEVVQLTQGVTDEKEKVKIIYDYLARTTRYVSIQLGIGGLQPIEASVVARDHFGDCKGLTNYMKAMLQVVGVPSVYSVISTDNENLMSDFASANQMNHVILSVPLAQETLWLECTNPQIPLGYIHHQIAGHETLQIKETGGEVVRLPSYPDSLNTEFYCVEAKIEESGKANMKVKRTSHLRQYEGLVGYARIAPKEQIDYLRRGLQLPQAVVSNSIWEERKRDFPEMQVTYDITSEQYGTRTGNRLFIPLNIFRSGFGNLNEKKRTHDICVDYGYKDSDTIRIEIPENYTVESLPRPINLDTSFGRFDFSLQIDGKDILITQTLHFPSGKYKPEEYPAFISFCRDVTSAYKGKIVLCKK